MFRQFVVLILLSVLLWSASALPDSSQSMMLYASTNSIGDDPCLEAHADLVKARKQPVRGIFRAVYRGTIKGKRKYVTISVLTLAAAGLVADVALWLLKPESHPVQTKEGTLSITLRSWEFIRDDLATWKQGNDYPLSPGEVVYFMNEDQTDLDFSTIINEGEAAYLYDMEYRAAREAQKVLAEQFERSMESTESETDSDD